MAVEEIANYIPLVGQTIAAMVGFAVVIPGSTVPRQANPVSGILENVDGEWVFNGKPCPFLAEKGCSIYDDRPEMCREYPFTDKDELVSRLLNLIRNCEVCPVVFEILERLKKRYLKEFQHYKRAMRPYWR